MRELDPIREIDPRQINRWAHNLFRPFECECYPLEALTAELEGRPPHLCPLHQADAIAQRARDDEQRQAEEEAARLRIVAAEVHDTYHGTTTTEAPACTCGPLAGLASALQTGESPACAVHRPDPAVVTLPRGLPAALHDAFTPPTDPTDGNPAAA